MCTPCSLVNKLERCDFCPLTRYFTSSEDDTRKLLILARNYDVTMLRRKIEDLENTASSVHVWITMECHHLSQQIVLENRVDELESSLKSLMISSGKEKVLEDTSSKEPSTDSGSNGSKQPLNSGREKSTSQSASKRKKITSGQSTSASVTRRESVPFSVEEFKTLIHGLKLLVDKLKVEDGKAPPNVYIWSSIRRDHFDGSIRKSGDLKDIFTRSVEKARAGLSTSTMQLDDIQTVLEIDSALKAWRVAKLEYSKAKKPSK